MTQIEARVALDHMQLIAVRNALAVEPGLVIESYRVNDKNVAVPMGDRVTHPEGLEILRMTTAVKKQLAITMNVALVENDDKRWSLHKFLRKRRNTRNARRKASGLWIIFAE